MKKNNGATIWGKKNDHKLSTTPTMTPATTTPTTPTTTPTTTTTMKLKLATRMQMTTS